MSLFSHPFLKAFYGKKKLKKLKAKRKSEIWFLVQVFIIEIICWCLLAFILAFFGLAAIAAVKEGDSEYSEGSKIFDNGLVDNLFHGYLPENKHHGSNSSYFLAKDKKYENLKFFLGIIIVPLKIVFSIVVETFSEIAGTIHYGARNYQQMIKLDEDLKPLKSAYENYYILTFLFWLGLIIFNSSVLLISLFVLFLPHLNDGNNGIISCVILLACIVAFWASNPNPDHELKQKPDPDPEEQTFFPSVSWITYIYFTVFSAICSAVYGSGVSVINQTNIELPHRQEHRKKIMSLVVAALSGAGFATFVGA